jgi:hypothetical protein
MNIRIKLKKPFSLYRLNMSITDYQRYMMPLLQLSEPEELKERVLAMKTTYFSNLSNSLTNYIGFLGDLQSIQALLKKHYLEETSDKTLFRDSGSKTVGWGIDYNQSSYWGLDAWITEQRRPSPHGGYPGEQWGRETCDAGQTQMLVPALVQAYLKCKQARKAKKEAEEAVVREEREKVEKRKREKEETYEKNWKQYQQYKDKYLREDSGKLLRSCIYLSKDLEPLYHEDSYKRYLQYHMDLLGRERGKQWMKEVEEVTNDLVNSLIEKWISLLIDSMAMHWFPERIEKGIRRPGEWKPDFNLDLVAKMEKICGTVLGKRIKEDAWKKSKSQRELLGLFQEKNTLV